MLNLSNSQFGQHNKMDMDVWGGQAWKMSNQEPIKDEHPAAAATSAAGEY
jgi:hypothetical protein